MMLYRRASPPSDHLGLTLGIVIPLAAVLLVSILLFLRRKLQRRRGSVVKKPSPLPLFTSGIDASGVPNSATSYTSTFTFPQTKRPDSALTDLKDPFRFPTSTPKAAPIFELPSLPRQAVVLTAHRAYAAPPPRNVNMSESVTSSTLEIPHPYGAQKNEKDNKDDPEEWLSYYEEDHPPFTRPPSYHRSPIRTRSHSPLSIHLRSPSPRQPKALSRRPSTPALSRRLSQPLDITISTDVHVHIDSMYVESHGDHLHPDEAADDNGEGLRIVSVAPQIPSMYISSMSLGMPFDTFGELGDTEFVMENPEGDRKSQAVTLESTHETMHTIELTQPASPRTLDGDHRATSPSIKTLDTAVVKDSWKVPPGWF